MPSMRRRFHPSLSAQQARGGMDAERRQCAGDGTGERSAQDRRHKAKRGLGFSVNHKPIDEGLEFRRNQIQDWWPGKLRGSRRHWRAGGNLAADASPSAIRPWIHVCASASSAVARFRMSASGSTFSCPHASLAPLCKRRCTCCSMRVCLCLRHSMLLLRSKSPAFR